jgi:hypothetical protein
VWRVDRGLWAPRRRRAGRNSIRVALNDHFRRGSLGLRLRTRRIAIEVAILNLSGAHIDAPDERISMRVRARRNLI